MAEGKLPNDTDLSGLKAQQTAIETAIVTRAEQTASDAQISQQSWWTAESAMTISSVVLAFGIVTVVIAAFLIRDEKDSGAILKVLATILILTFAVFLIVAGYSDRQIAPAIGLLGTIAGYLLGKDSGKGVVTSVETKPNT